MWGGNVTLRGECVDLSNAKRIDIVNGPMVPNIFRFILPLIATGVLQLLYNAADNVVVGRFDGAVALAAVGSTGALVNLLLNICMGFSVGSTSCAM